MHSTLIDYRFRVSSSIHSKVYGSKLLYLESGIQVRSKLKKSKRGSKGQKISSKDHKNSVDKDSNTKTDQWAPKSAAEFLFCDENGEMPESIDPDDADYLYNEYTTIIKTLFRKLSKSYNLFSKQVIKDKEVLKKKGIPEFAPKLVPPGFHDKVERLKEEHSKEIDLESTNPEETKSIAEAYEEAKIKYQISDDGESMSTVSLKQFDSNKDKFEEEYEKLQHKFEQFSKRVDLKTPSEVATKLLMEVNEYSCQLFSLWNEYIQLLMIDQGETVKFFKMCYQKIIYERWCESIFRDVNITTDFYHSSDSSKVGEKHAKIATKQRSSSHYQNLTPLPIEDTGMFPDWNNHPILFEELYIKDKEIFEEEEKKRSSVQIQELVEKNNTESHLIVLVHGFQGNSEDLRMLRNNLL